MLASSSRALSCSLLRRSLSQKIRRQHKKNTTASSTTLRSLSSDSTAQHSHTTFNFTPEEQGWYDQGIIDERGLTVFDNLHSMQVHSCHVFRNKPLFGTFSDDTKAFEWMSFQEYADRVDQCRAMLKDLGELSE
jgi:hypothetical protein